MSKTKNEYWDDIENDSHNDDSAQAAVAEGKAQAATIAGQIVDNLSGNELQWLAEELIECDQDKAESLASSLTFAIQDKHYSDLLNIVKSSNTGGTHLHGHIHNRSYDDLIKAFGEPHFRYQPRAGAEDKIDVEWAFEFPDGRVFTVYNWKNGKAYCGTHGEDVEDMTEWNVGAHKQSTYDAVIEMLSIKLGAVKNDTKE